MFYIFKIQIHFSLNSVFVLNQLYPDKAPLLLKAAQTTTSIVDEDLDFFIEENIDVYFACSLTLNGEFYLFGGDHFDTAVSAYF